MIEGNVEATCADLDKAREVRYCFYMSLYKANVRRDVDVRDRDFPFRRNISDCFGLRHRKHADE